MISPSDLVAMLEKSALTCRPRLEAELVLIGEGLKLKAREFIGHEHSEWPPLAASTVEEKTKKGYVGRISATDPLYRRGDLRESIDMTAFPAELLVVVGSADKTALYQEIGTSRIPPRPFFMPAVMQSAELATKALGEVAASLVGGIK